MTNKEKFIEEINNFLQAKGGLSLSEEALTFFKELKEEKNSTGGLTETGKMILEWLNTEEHVHNYFSAKIIGEGLFTSSRTISGAARKLITDGYLEKEGKDPVTYKITLSGHNILLDSESN